MWRWLRSSAPAPSAPAQTPPALDAAGLFNLGRLRNNGLRQENLQAIRQLCHSAYMGQSLAVCRVLGRFLMYVDTTDRRLGVRMQMDGFWEPQVTEWVARCVQPNMHTVDVGANYGYFTLLMAALGAPNGTVTAIEPNPSIARLLHQTIDLAPSKRRITDLAVAVGAEAGSLPFRECLGSPMNARFLRVDETQAPHIEVDVRPLDALIAPGQRVDFMKVDIEGAERDFWTGAKRVIKENPGLQILMEVNYRRYPDPERFFESIVDAGFNIDEISSPSGKLEKRTAQQLMDPAVRGHRMLLLRRPAVST